MGEPVTLLGKADVLEYLGQSNALEAECLIALFVDDTFRLLGRIDGHLTNPPFMRPSLVCAAALTAGARGIIIAENWLSRAAMSQFWLLREYRQLQLCLEETEVFLLDVLVICEGQVRSRTGLGQPISVR